ncbi:ankyrin repeat and SOCS box protein 3-like isoform X2 [Ruditapes philippinarum]|nr:ankyrin repeat and SOCS box protein 3-like isoform X2 [Ruditapes philippinarum]
MLKMLTSMSGSCNPRELNLGLIKAASLGYSDCIKCLLDVGADKNFVNQSNQTPLYAAVQNNKKETVKLLLENNTDVNLISGLQHLSALHIAAMRGYSDIVDLLVEHKASVHSRDYEGNTPLVLAARNGHYLPMKSLLKAGCDVNAANYEGCTSLHFACHKARGFQVLLDAGADPNVRDNDNITPLLMAASEGFDNVVKALVDFKCDVNIPNDSVKRTALHLLAYKGHADSINALVYAGAEIDACDIYGRTPLWYAIENKKSEVVRLLLKSYSHVDTFQCQTSSEENCPAKLAFKSQQFDVIKLFMLSGYEHAHVRECLQSDEYADWVRSLQADDEFSHWLDFGSSAQTLKQLCRKWIRHHLGRHFYHHLQHLPIPDVMRNYLHLEELLDH